MLCGLICIITNNYSVNKQHLDWIFMNIVTIYAIKRIYTHIHRQYDGISIMTL